MVLKLYDTLKRKKEALKLKGKSLGIYTCGPNKISE